MTVKRLLINGLGGLWLAAACGSGRGPATSPPPDSGGISDAAIDAAAPLCSSNPGAMPAPAGGSIDPNPSFAFTQVGLAAGIKRSNEPASAGTFDPTNTLAYG